MKNNKQGRKRSSGVPCRRLIRLSPESAEIFDRYSDSDLAEVVNRAMLSIFPKVADAPSVPTVIRPVKVLTETICRIAIVGREVRLIFPEKLMANLVKEMIQLGQTDQDIAKHLGMEAEEVLRLKQMTGLAGLFKGQSYSKAWEAI